MIKSGIYAALTIAVVIAFALGLTFFDWFRILTMVAVLGGLLFAVWLFLFDEFEQNRIAKQKQPKINFPVKSRIQQMEEESARLKEMLAELEKKRGIQ